MIFGRSVRKMNGPQDNYGTDFCIFIRLMAVKSSLWSLTYKIKDFLIKWGIRRCNVQYHYFKMLGKRLCLYETSIYSAPLLTILNVILRTLMAIPNFFLSPFLLSLSKTASLFGSAKAVSIVVSDSEGRDARENSRERQLFMGKTPLQRCGNLLHCFDVFAVFQPVEKIKN